MTMVMIPYGGEYMIQIDNEDFGTLAVCSLRYCSNRHTYMPDLVRGIIMHHLSEISDKDLQVMINDMQYKFIPFGKLTDYHQEGWDEWHTILLNEQARRES